MEELFAAVAVFALNVCLLIINTGIPQRFICVEVDDLHADKRLDPHIPRRYFDNTAAMTLSGTVFSERTADCFRDKKASGKISGGLLI